MKTKAERLMTTNGVRADSGVGGINGKKPSKSSQILPTPSRSSSSSSLSSRASKRVKTLDLISASNSLNSIKSSRSIQSSASIESALQKESGDYPFEKEIPPIDALIPGSYGPEVDYWCLGLILHECGFGRLPFAEPPGVTDRNSIAEYIQHAITNCEVSLESSKESTVHLSLC